MNPEVAKEVCKNPSIHLKKNHILVPALEVPISGHTERDEGEGLECYLNLDIIKYAQ